MVSRILFLRIGLLIFILNPLQVNIVCPLYDEGTELPPDGVMEKFIIYVVNKEEYDTCRIMDQHPRTIAQCDTPRQLQLITISFRSFSPTPGALEYSPGSDYYFISTSSKVDLHQRVGGMCRDNNMKLVFKVADPNAPPSTTTTTTTTTSTTTTTTTKFRTPEDDSSATRDLSEGKEGKRRRRKKWRRRRKHNKDSNVRSSEEGGARWKKDKELDFLHDEEFETRDSSKSKVVFAEKELSMVEKVNNLMKQEASIRASSSSSSSFASGRMRTNYFFSFLFLLLSFVLSWVIC